MFSGLPGLKLPHDTFVLQIFATSPIQDGQILLFPVSVWAPSSRIAGQSSPLLNYGCEDMHSQPIETLCQCLEMKKLFITHIRTVTLHPLLQLSVEQFHWMDGKWDSNLTSVSIQLCRFVVLMSTGSLLDVVNLQAVRF